MIKIRSSQYLYPLFVRKIIDWYLSYSNSAIKIYHNRNILNSDLKHYLDFKNLFGNENKEDIMVNFLNCILNRKGNKRIKNKTRKTEEDFGKLDGRTKRNEEEKGKDFENNFSITIIKEFEEIVNFLRETENFEIIKLFE
ncbi:hypothetical protein U3516DRAFT_753690 [Neocallimastix sp. 'constans']